MSVQDPEPEFSPADHFDHILDGRLRMRHLTAIIAVADTGGFGRAAQVLRVAQPAVTRSVAEAEKALGVVLFTRSPQGATLTPAGRVFDDHARAVLKHLRLGARYAKNVAEETGGSLVVGTHLSGKHRLLSEAIVALLAVRPDVRIELVEATPDQLLRQLRSGDIDILVGRVDRQAETSDLVARPLAIEAVTPVVRRNHPAALNGTKSLADLREHLWLLPSNSTRVGRFVRSGFTQAGVELPGRVITHSTISLPETLLLSTDLVAIVPEGMVSGDDRFVALDCPEVTMERTLGDIVLRGTSAHSSVSNDSATVRDFQSALERVITSVGQRRPVA